MKKVFSVVLAAALLLAALPAAAAAASPELVTQLADHLYLHRNSFYNSNAQGDINENFFVYTPNSAVTPYLAHGNDVAGAASMARIFRLEAEAGNTLIAACNADYFSLANGVPLGIEIKDGIIKSSSSFKFPEVGFSADGRAVIGRSGLNITLKNTSRGISLSDMNYNKALSDESGAVIFDRGFEETNRAVKETLNVSVSVSGGSAVANGSICGTVKEVFESSGALELREDELLISIYKTSYSDIQSQLSKFSVGDGIEISFAMDTAWQDIKHAFGGKEMLVNGGVPEVFSVPTRAPRTAIGVKSDGGVVLYSCDGREAGGSKGLSLTELARRMSQLGCVSALNLDGGASTQLFATIPGNEANEQINVSSGSKLRSCANYICFKNNLSPSGEIAKLIADPAEIMVVRDGETEIRFKAVDTHWYPLRLDPSLLSYQLDSSLGSIENGLLKTSSLAGDGVLTASINGKSASLKLKLVSDWPLIDAVYADGFIKADIKDPLEKGFSAANIRLTLDGRDMEFGYAAESGQLTVPVAGDGLLHHAVIKVTNDRGHISRKAIDVMAPAASSYDGSSEAAQGGAEPAAPIFADMSSSDWAFKYAEYLYRNNIISGVVKNDKRYYKPSENMTRQEFTKVVVAAMGIDLSEHESCKLSFADSADIADWALSYVKAAVSLGIMNGSTRDGVSVFNPKASISRQEVMTVIGKLLGSGYESAELSEFKDSDSVAIWAYPYVQLLVKQGIVSGYDGKLDPEGKISRAQVAKILYEFN